MKQTEPYVITISRMLGSGGVIIGRQLSEKLNIAYFDKEIVSKAADEFGLMEEDLQRYDEKRASFWDSLLRSSMMKTPDSYGNPLYNLPSDRQLVEAERKIIRTIAAEHSAVIIGRGGVHVLHDHPRHISIFLHCEVKTRQQRVQELLKVTEKEAKRMIAENDLKRGQHFQLFTDRPWTDARQYTLCIDTGKIGLDRSASLILECVEEHLGIKPQA